MIVASGLLPGLDSSTSWRWRISPTPFSSSWSREFLDGCPGFCDYQCLFPLGHSVFFLKNIYTMHCNHPFSSPSFNSTKKNYFTETNVISLVLFFNVGIFVPLITFILPATLLIISLKRHTLHMESNATGSRDPSMEAHVGTIKAISYFLIF